MGKKIIVFASTVDTLGRDHGEKEMIIEINGSRITLLEPGIIKKKRWSSSADVIACMDVFVEKNVVQKSVLKRAAVGGLLTGNMIGAAIGGLSGTGKSDAWYFEIVFNNQQGHIFRFKQPAERVYIEKYIKKYSKKFCGLSTKIPDSYSEKPSTVIYIDCKDAAEAEEIKNKLDVIGIKYRD